MDTRILDVDHNYTRFFDNTHSMSLVTSNKSKDRILLSLDLDTVGSPNQYFLTFGLFDTIFKKQVGLCQVADFIDTVAYIPPAEFSISISQNPLILRPGDEKTIQLKVMSSTIVRPNISLSTDQNRDIELNFIPNKTYLPPAGMAASIIKIRASEKAADCPYILPIYTNISFPKIDFVNLGLDNAASITNKITTSIIPRPSYFTVIVKPPLSWQEQFKEIWSTYGGAINFVGGGFAAGFAALIFDRIRKVKRDKEKVKGHDKYS